MPIEIKELTIRVKIEDERKNTSSTLQIDNTQLEKLKKEITDHCVELVLEKIKERSER